MQKIVVLVKKSLRGLKYASKNMVKILIFFGDQNIKFVINLHMTYAAVGPPENRKL